ncbi:MAG: BspA family leucine-rich repeat surface protein [Dysgonomonas sp.]|uniref:BspA family leucine-rich repeat surface protein n=1 Tax=Dysgonomonas sp. TaxID=1891233 RepID=UPI0039E5EBCE
MTKISLFFISLLTILITGCNNDDYYERGSSDTKQSKTAHWYGVKQLSDSVSLRSAADRMKLWAQDPVITVKFLNSPDDPAVIDQIKAYAKEWEQYAGVTFSFVETSENALVRIGFDWDGNSWLTWSYTGNDAKMVRNQNEPTACFGGFSDGVMSDEEIKGDVLRVFGQILGLEFEQRHLGWDPSWWKKDKNGVYYAEKYWEGMFDGYYENLDWETIRQFVFDPLAGATIVQTADVDFESIMMWPYYTKKETVKLYANYELSDGDKEFIATLYPKKEGNTIQTAWVDAGYFVWVNAEKTQLRITEKGAQMEELPDVIDGEQLTSAEEMFSYTSLANRYMSYMKIAPFFNASNIKNFSYMFKSCTNLKSIPSYDTSKGEDFGGMFYECRGLQTIPLLDTSNGLYFGVMFKLCTSLKSIPLIDTSNGTNFGAMFENCGSLPTIPAINTSKGINFARMFADSKVASIPELDTSEGLYFHQMFWGDGYLKDFPVLNVSKGHCFSGMFHHAVSVQNIKLNGFGESEVDCIGWCSPVESANLDIFSSQLEVSSLQYLVDHTTGSLDPRVINLHKSLQSKVSVDLIAQAAAKNIKFEFIY